MAVYEMGKYISGIGNKTSSGPDEISNQLLELASPYNDCRVTINYIFNLHRAECLPIRIHKTEVILLHKTRDHKNLNDYRPNSLLSVLSKLLERQLHRHLVTLFWSHDTFFIHLKSVFRGKHSCNTALMDLYT